MIYLKGTIAGLLAVFAAAVLMVVIGVVCVLIVSRSLQGGSEGGSIGWDPISLARPLKWLMVTIGIFLIGFFWEFFRIRSK